MTLSLQRASRASATILLILCMGSLSALAGKVKQVTDLKDVSFDWPMPNGDGSEIFVATSSNADGLNPNHLFRIVAYNTTTGVGTAITSFPASLVHLRHNVSVTEDGQWLAFISDGDLIPGQNPTRADQAFSIKRDGMQLTQLTHITGPNGGGVIRIAMAGTADRVMIATSADLTGGNPQRAHQVFVVKRDGSNPIQVTNAPSGSIDHLWISDDGTRIAFNHTGDLTGGNPDHNNEVFAITVGDAAPRQITSSTVGASDSANISGDGSTIVFESTADYTGGNPAHRDLIFAADWTTGAITQVVSDADNRQPWPTNDGSTIFFARNSPVHNVYKINKNGTGLTQLSDFSEDVEHPVVSGDGNYFGVWLESGLYEGLGSGISTIQLIARSIPFVSYAEMSSDAQKAVVWSRADLTGANPNHVDQIFSLHTDGTAVTQLTNAAPGEIALRPQMNGAGTRIYYESSYDPLGTNLDHNNEIFGINPDGTGLVQYTNCNSPTNTIWSGYVEVSDDGNTIVFTSLCNLTGGNPGPNTAPVFKIKPDGTGLTQLTTIPSAPTLTTYNYYPRMDQIGNWIVMGGNANINNGNPNHNFEIFRIKSDKTGFQQITNYYPYWSLFPDVNFNGTRYSFESQGDPLGTNPDHNWEIFLYRTDVIPNLRQITNTTKGDNKTARFSRDGRYVYFASTSEFIENDPDHAFSALYRYDVNTDTIQRSGGLRFDDTNFDWQPSVNGDGSKVLYSTFRDATGANPDEYWDIELIDYNAPNPPVVSGGPAPTTVSFAPEPGMVRYDIIRGDVASLHNVGSTVDLGTVTCLKNDSGDTSTVGYPDSVTPAPGQVFFYLFRGTPGQSAGPGSYGTGNAGERVTSGGDCATN